MSDEATDSVEDCDVLVVKVELYPFGFKKYMKELSRLTVVNDGTGNRQTGFYDVATSRDGGVTVDRKGRIENYPRIQGDLELVARALKSVGYGKQP